MNKEQWLIDYIEGELNDRTHFEMGRIIRSSSQDMELVSSVNALKKIMRHHDEVLEPKASDLKRMHNNIMEQILQRNPARTDQQVIALPTQKVRTIHLHLV